MLTTELQRGAESDDDSGRGEPLLIKLSRIDPMPDQPRRWYDTGKLNELADDIQENGHKKPVRVFRDPQRPGRFVLIGGERRWRAFGIIAERTGKDPLVKTFLDTAPKNAEQHFEEAFVDNLRREDLIARDEAAAYSRMHTQAGKSFAEIAKLAGKSTSHITNYIALHKLPDAVKDLMEPSRPKEQRLSVSSAIDIAKSVTNPALQLEIAKESIERRLGVSDTRGLIHHRVGKLVVVPGERVRKPSDDYKLLRSFIGTTLRRAQGFARNFDIENIYLHRDGEEEDRKFDVSQIDLITSELEKLRAKIAR